MRLMAGGAKSRVWFQQQSFLGHDGSIMFGSVHPFFVSVASGAQLVLVDCQQFLVRSAVYTVAGLAYHLVMASPAKFGSSLAQFFRNLPNPFDVFEHRVVALFCAGGPVDMASETETGIDILDAQKNGGELLLFPIHPMSTVTGTTVNLPFLVHREDGFPIKGWDLDLFWWFDTYRMKMFTLRPSKARVKDESIMAGEAHAFGTDDILLSSIDHRLWIVGNQGCCALACEIGQPHDMANGAFPIGGDITAGQSYPTG